MSYDLIIMKAVRWCNNTMQYVQQQSNDDRTQHLISFSATIILPGVKQSSRHAKTHRCITSVAAATVLMLMMKAMIHHYFIVDHKKEQTRTAPTVLGVEWRKVEMV